MKDNWRRIIKSAVVVMAAGAVVFNTTIGGALDKGDSLSQSNEQITMLYLDALNFYKEGQYSKAKRSVEKIFEIIQSDFYVSGVRRALKVPPDEDTLAAFQKKIQDKEADLQKAKKAYKDKDYPLAAQIFLILREESPQSVEIQKYLDKIADLKIQERLKGEDNETRLLYQLTQGEEKTTLTPAQKQELVNEQIMAIEREGELKRLAEQGVKQEQEYLVRQNELARLKQEQLQKIQQIKEESARKLKEKEAEIEQNKQEMENRVSEIRKSAVQEQVLAEAVLEKQRKDKAKVYKIEKLWREAKRLYNMGMYEEAIKNFQQVIELEGNPRIKYTPAAKELIEKSKEKMVEKKQDELSVNMELKEKEMINEVLSREVPSYVEPPLVFEEKEAIPLIEPPLIRKKLKAAKVNMEFDKMDLKSVMLFLSKESGINLILSQKVLEKGFKVSVRFTETPIEEVIKYITKSQGLVYRIDKDLIWIALPEEVENEPLETRVYYLSRGGGLFTEFTPLTGGGTESGLGSSSASISKISTIEDTLKEVISWPSDAKLTYDKRINALIVRNTPQNLQMLEDMLYSLDVLPYQILIEARFLEVDITDIKELGLTWQFNADFPLLKEKGQNNLVFTKDSGSSFSSYSRGSEGLNLTYKGLLSTPRFQTVLHALEESKKIKTLSSPRITTLNNQPATIKVVDEWIYPTRYEYEIVQFDLNGDGDYNDAGETTYKNVPKDFIRRDVGILLKVIPSVGADKKTINLSLIPEVSEGTQDYFVYTGDVKLPKFTSRNLATTVVVNSGDTVVLGGMIKESRTKTKTGVPFFSAVPFFGEFFKKNTDSITRKNLLIFVTAKILSVEGEEVIVTEQGRK